MFSELFTLVRSNAGMAVIDNPLVPAAYREAVLNEAASTIIDGMKVQVETGKLKDMVKYFQYPGIYYSPLVGSLTKSFANKLNSNYGISINDALSVANELIPVVMQQLAERTRDTQNKTWSLTALLTWLTDNQINVADFLCKLRLA